MYLALNAFRYHCQLVERGFLLVIFIAIVSGSCDQAHQLLYYNKTMEQEPGVAPKYYDQKGGTKHSKWECSCQDVWVYVFYPCTQLCVSSFSHFRAREMAELNVRFTQLSERCSGIPGTLGDV